MSDIVDKAEEIAATPGRLPRRTLAGRLAKVSAGLVAGAAGLASFFGSGHPAPAALAYCTNANVGAKRPSAEESATGDLTIRRVVDVRVRAAATCWN